MALNESRSQAPPSDWAAGGILFAAVMMTVTGVFQTIAGLTAIVGDEFFVVAKDYAFAIDTTAWGWIHLTLGGVVFLAGLSLFAGRTWARVFAVVLAALSAVSNFFFIPYYPVWSLLMIALACWVIWALTRPGAVRA